MNAWRSALIIGALAAGLAAPAHATKTLNTASALDFFSGGEKLYCNIVNTGTSAVNVTIQARYDNGMLQAQGSILLQPGQYDVLSAGNLVSSYCRFVIQGSSRGIRAEGVYIDPQTGHRTVAVPAR
jgi:hypothetical protein